MKNAQIVGTGYVVLDRIVVGGESETIEDLGGSCGNVLISLAMLGHRVAPLLRLGADAVGERLFADLRNAGAMTDWIIRSEMHGTPELIQYLDAEKADHRFSRRCPRTAKQFPTYRSVERATLRAAADTIRSSRIFYVDRLSASIVEAMEVARSSGCLVFFEPSRKGRASIFEKAIYHSHIVKISDDRLRPEDIKAIRPETIVVRTLGAKGVQILQGDNNRHLAAGLVKGMKDTCGAGDMLSVAIIDGLAHCDAPRTIAFEKLVSFVQRGQRLAAENCTHVGARGLIRERGPRELRRFLEED